MTSIAKRRPAPVAARHRATHQVSSGMGGVFDIAIVRDDEDGIVFVRVVTANPEWDGFSFLCHRSALLLLTSGSAR